MWKVIVFGPIFDQIWFMFKQPCKIGISAHFWKPKTAKKRSLILSGPSRGYYLGQVCRNIKMANLAQVITPEVFARNFLSNKIAETPVFWQTVFSKNRLGPDPKPLKWPTLAQIISPQHIYIYAVKFKTGPRFGGFKVKTGPSSKLKAGPSFYSPIFSVFFGYVQKHQ